jgi:cell division protein FtsL
MWHSGFLQGLLLVLVMTGALSVVTSQHQARKLFIALQQEKEHAHQMEIEWGQLQLEQSTWRHLRVWKKLQRSSCKCNCPNKSGLYG